ncbi:MAG: hypothetical protein V3W37_09175 [Candidatus Binatia bacterium]
MLKIHKAVQLSAGEIKRAGFLKDEVFTKQLEVQKATHKLQNFLNSIAPPDKIPALYEVMKSSISVELTADGRGVVVIERRD